MLPKPKNSITPTSILIKGCVYLDLLDPDPEVITLGAVAAGLEEPRWCNQTNRTITVADHLLRCARIAVAKDCTLAEVVACLLHDAAEAFLRDIPGPLKPHLRVAHGGDVLTYAEVERRMLRAICVALIPDQGLAAAVRDLLAEDGGIVKQIDSEALRIEVLRWLPGSTDWALAEIDPIAWMVAESPEGGPSWLAVAGKLSGVGMLEKHWLPQVNEIEAARDMRHGRLLSILELALAST